MNDSLNFSKEICPAYSHIILSKGDDPRIGSRVTIRGTFANCVRIGKYLLRYALFLYFSLFRIDQGLK
jgi:hypothetical protein